MNGTAGMHGGEDYQQWVEAKVAQGKASAQTQRHGAEVFSNTLPVRKVAPAKSKTAMSKNTHTEIQLRVSHTCFQASFLDLYLTKIHNLKRDYQHFLNATSELPSWVGLKQINLRKVEGFYDNVTPKRFSCEKTDLCFFSEKGQKSRER